MKKYIRKLNRFDFFFSFIPAPFCTLSIAFLKHSTLIALLHKAVRGNLIKQF